MGFIDGLLHFSSQGFCAGLHSAVTGTGLEISLKLAPTGQRRCGLCHRLNRTRANLIFDGSSCFQLCVTQVACQHLVTF